MDLAALRVANRAVGNAPGAAAIERYGPIELCAHDELVVADERGELTVLARGASRRFAWDGARRVGYLAIDGGLLVAPFLGGAGTMLSIARGGHEGRPLRRGDVLAIGAPREQGERVVLDEEAGPIRVTLGPDLDRLADAAVARLLEHAWTLDVHSDRMGTRLVGPRLAHRPDARVITTPMIEGAIECPPDGAPIVLGPEHPTTGGYPVIAVVVERDIPRLHRRPLGSVVRFTRA